MKCLYKKKKSQKKALLDVHFGSICVPCGSVLCGVHQISSLFLTKVISCRDDQLYTFRLFSIIIFCEITFRTVLSKSQGRLFLDAKVCTMEGENLTCSSNSRPKEWSGVCSKISPGIKPPNTMFLPSILRPCCQLCFLWLSQHQGSSQAVFCSRQSPASLHWVNSFYEVRR